MKVQQRCKIWLVFEKILTLIRHPAAKVGNLSYKTRLAEQVYLGSRGLLREIFMNNPKKVSFKTDLGCFQCGITKYWGHIQDFVGE